MSHFNRLGLNPFMPNTNFNEVARFKGGGNTQTTSSGVPDWARPYLESAASDAQSLYKGGALDNVAGFQGDQTAAQQQIRDQAGTAGQLNETATGVLGDQATGGGIFGAGAYGDVAGQLQPQIDDQVQRALGQQAGGVLT